MNRSIILRLVVLGVLGLLSSGYAIDIEDMDIEVVTVHASRSDGFSAGTSVTLQIHHDSLIFARIDKDGTRLTKFSDDMGFDLIRPGESIERRSNIFSTRALNGIDHANADISRDGHTLSVNINSMAVPSKGSNTLTVAGVLVLFVEDNEKPVELPFDLTFGVGGI